MHAQESVAESAPRRKTGKPTALNLFLPIHCQPVLRRLADSILEFPPDQRWRVGIDGVDDAGKTIFADKLASLIEVADDKPSAPPSILFTIQRLSGFAGTAGPRAIFTILLITQS
jgi:hypothetical protein